MPATWPSGPAKARSLGVDGCALGWVAVGAAAPQGCEGLPTRDEPLSLMWSVARSLFELAPLMDQAGTCVLDVPIGLGDGPPRPCDALARRRLGPRRASVFSPPARAALEAGSRTEATAIGQALRPGGGLSAQVWNIMPKIREADAFVSPADQDRLREGHPELAFARLGGAPCAWPKKAPAGRAERLRLLEGRGVLAEVLIGDLRAHHPRRAVADDDVIDACALALTGLDAMRGRAWRLGGERDARGLRMEIWG